MSTGDPANHQKEKKRDLVRSVSDTGGTGRNRVGEGENTANQAVKLGSVEK
jgi:hypothetical protein